MRKLGTIGDKETENEVLLLEHDVPHSKFSETVLSFLPKMPWTITEEVCVYLNTSVYPLAFKLKQILRVGNVITIQGFMYMY